MGKTYLVCDTDAAVKEAEDATWEKYYAEQLAARGLLDGDGLDVRQDGTRVRVTTRYVVAEKIDGVAGGIVPIDAMVLSMDGVEVTTDGGKVTLDVVAVDEKALPAKFKPIIDAKTAVEEPAKVVK